MGCGPCSGLGHKLSPDSFTTLEIIDCGLVISGNRSCRVVKLPQKCPDSNIATLEVTGVISL